MTKENMEGKIMFSMHMQKKKNLSAFAQGEIMQLCYSLLRNLETIGKLTCTVLFSHWCEFAFSRELEGSHVDKNSKTVGTNAAAFFLIERHFQNHPTLPATNNFNLLLFFGQRCIKNTVMPPLLSQN